MAMSLIRTTATLPINPGTADLISFPRKVYALATWPREVTAMLSGAEDSGVEDTIEGAQSNVSICPISGCSTKQLRNPH